MIDDKKSTFCTWCYAALFLMLLCLLSAKVHAQAQTLELDSFYGGLVPGQDMRLLDDLDADMDFEEARAQLDRRGQAWISYGHPNLGYRRAALWVRVDISNRFEEVRQWVAYSNFSNLARIDFYYQDANGSWQTHAAGSSLPFRARHLTHRSINFEFPVLPGQAQALYFRVESTGSLQFPLALSSRDQFLAEAQRSLFITGIYYGLMLMIAIYSFTVWYSSREKGFLYFGLLVICGSLHSLAAQGLAFQYLWPESPDWASSATSVFSLFACVTGLLFVRTFLGLRDLDARLDSCSRILAMAAGAAIVLAISLGAVIANWLALIFTFVLATLVTLSGFLAHRKHIREASFFVSAWVILLVGIFMEVAQRMGVLVPPLLAYQGVQLASLSAIVVLSLGLSDRLQGMMIGYRTAQSDILKANQLKIDALQQADSVKEEFIANVSHELRTPLTGIIGLAEIMLADRAGDLNPSQRETLTLMKVSAQRLASLVNDVIDFSAMKNGQLSLKRTDVDLKQVCSIVVRMTRPLIGDKPIKLIEKYPPLQVIVEGDEDRLQQVLFNLVANAVKFTPHGSVTISVELLDADVRVSVRDTGVGISSAEQKNIFQRFYQVDSDEARQVGGAGLGLSISQRLLELHDSEIILRSKTGEGSLFYFDLPLKHTQAEGKRAKVELPSAATELAAVDSCTPDLSSALQASGLAEDRRKTPRTPEADTDLTQQPARTWSGRILIVDDEYLNLRILESHLSDTYELTTALSGAEALEKLSQQKPDLIILDLMMPVMTGYQVCQIIRKRYDPSELPIVILTAKNRVEDLVKGLSLGANDYITKPFSKDELRIRIDKQFELMHLQHVKRENQRLSWQLQRYEESERRLREREQRLAALLDVTGDPLLAIDEAGLVIFVNQSAEQLLGVEADEVVQRSVNHIAEHLSVVSAPLSQAIHFPFHEATISRPGDTAYFDFDMPAGRGRFCLLTLNQMDQELYLLVFELERHTISPLTDIGSPEGLSLPQIVGEINRNVERTHRLAEYLQQISADDLHKHPELTQELGHIDQLITRISGSISAPADVDSELQYREALVKVMQDCHYYWQKVTGESIIDLAEKSRIWSVSIDNGRLRTRSMNRYLSLDKLPSNPRWRQVARTAYFVLSKVSSNEEARIALEASVARLQEIVEQKALT